MILLCKTAPVTEIGNMQTTTPVPIPGDRVSTLNASAIAFTPQCCQGEGGTLAIKGTGPGDLPGNNDGRWPPRNSGSTSAPKFSKRSYKRACLRAIQFGHTWYRGRLQPLHAFPQHLRDRLRPQVPRRTEPPTSNHTHRLKKRLACLSWNTSGLSSSRFKEISLWMQQQGIHLFTLQETKWDQHYILAGSALHLHPQ